LYGDFSFKTPIKEYFIYTFWRKRVFLTSNKALLIVMTYDVIQRRLITINQSVYMFFDFRIFPSTVVFIRSALNRLLFERIDNSRTVSYCCKSHDQNQTWFLCKKNVTSLKSQKSLFALPDYKRVNERIHISHN